MFDKNTIYNQDALEAIKKIDDNSISVIITDPPYYLGFSSTDIEKGRQDWSQYTLLTPLFDFLFKEFVRILKRNGRIFIFTDWRTYPSLYLSASKFIKVSNLIVWDYGWIKAGNQFRFTHELILHATMPEAKPPKNRATPDVWRIPPINFSRERNHPSEKPIDIIHKILLETTDKGDLILDPFLGSGTTAIACKHLSRDFIGFELDYKYFEISLGRLKQTNIIDFIELEEKPPKETTIDFSQKTLAYEGVRS